MCWPVNRVIIMSLEVYANGGFVCDRPVQKEDTYPFTWTTPDQSSAPEKIEAALHRSLVEIFTLLSEGRSPLDASKASNKNATDWTVAVRIDPSEDKESAVLSFSSVEIRERVLEVMTAKARKDGKKKGLTGAMEEVAQETEAEAEAEAGEEDVAEDAVRTEAEASGEVKSEAVEAAVEDNRSIEKDASIAAESEIELYDKYNPEVEDPDEGDTTEAQDQTTPPENKSKAVEPVPWGERWMSISISDPIIKFAVRIPFSPFLSLLSLLSPSVPPNIHQTQNTKHKTQNKTQTKTTPNRTAPQTLHPNHRPARSRQRRAHRAHRARRLRRDRRLRA